MFSDLPPLNSECSYPEHTWGGVCGGHGKCVDSLCVCDAGWTGKSEWMSFDGYTCTTNEAAIQALWAINVVLWLKTTVEAVKICYFEHGKAKGDFKAALARDGFRYAFFEFITNLSYGVIALCRIGGSSVVAMNPDTQFGGFLLVLYGWTCGIFYLVTVFATELQCNVALKGMGSGKDKEMAQVRAVMRLLRPKAAMDGFVMVSSTIISVCYPNSKKTIITSFVCAQVWRSISMIFGLGQVVSIKKAVLKAFEGVKVEKGDKIYTLQQSMSGVQKDGIKAVFINGTLCLMTAFWKPFWGNFSYVLAFTWILLQVVQSAANKTLLAKTKGGKGNKVGSSSTSSGSASHSSTSSKDSSQGSAVESTNESK